MSAQAIAFLSFPIQISEPTDWKNLTDTDKADIKAGLTNGSLSY